MSPDEPTDPPSYPTQWEADVVLADGGIARLRPIRPDDAALLVDFYGRVSEESKYFRFFAPYPRLSRRDVERFTQLDYADRVAFILTVGEEMIGVGRYDRLDDNDRAEVAFLVEDAHQGRGVGQLLLEHLAEAARESGITGFIAEVLPENQRMAQVFIDAGYHVHRGYEDGLLTMEFPIRPTETSVGVMERREHQAEGTSIRRLLQPDRVLLVGDGARTQRISTALLAGGFRGEVVAVSTDGVPISGVPTASSIATVTGTVDLAVVLIDADDLGSTVIEVAHKGVHAMVVLTGAGIGVADSHRVVSLARAYGIRALGPDALGLINTNGDVGLNASPSPMPQPGNVGMFCQSAATGVAILSEAMRQDVGVSSFLSTGEYADVSGNDVMQYWEDDDDTAVCLLSLDTLGNPRKFTRIIRRLTRRKPVVVFSPGRSHRQSHAGDRGGLRHAKDVAVDALFRQSGVIVVDRREEMVQIGQLASKQPLPAGPRVRLAVNSETLAHQLRHTIRSDGLVADDPMVLPAGQPAEEVATLVRQALADDTCDAVVCAVVGVFGSDSQQIRTALDELAQTSRKPLLAAFLDFAEFTDFDNEDGIGGKAGTTPAGESGSQLPIFETSTDAVHALAALSSYAHWRKRGPGTVPQLEGADEHAGKQVINRVLVGCRDGRRLSDTEAGDLLASYGIRLIPQQRVDTLDEAIDAGDEYGWGVVLKATAAATRGRPDLATVFRNLSSADAVRRAWHDLDDLVTQLGIDADAGPAAVEPVVQPMVPAGVSLQVASREDAAFGPIVELSLAGAVSDLLGDTVYRVPPLTTADAKAMVRDLGTAPMLFGQHGGPGVDIPGVEDLVHRVAQMADDLPQLSRVLLTPCIASRDGVAVLGARIETAPTHDQRDPLARTL